MHNPIVSAFFKVKDVLDYDQKRRAMVMILLLLVNAIFDFAGLATIAMLIFSALEESIFDGAEYVRSASQSDVQYYFNSKLRDLYDLSGAVNQMAFLFYLSIIIFAAFILKNAVSIWIGYIQSKFAYNVSLRLNKKMFKHFYDRGYLFIKDSTSGKKVYSIVDVPMRFASHFLNTFLIMGTEIVVVTIIFVVLLFFNPVACALLFLAIIPTFYVIYNFSKNRAREIGIQRNTIAPKNYAKVFESMNAYVDIKLGNFENEMLEKYIDLQKKLNTQDILFYGIYQKLNQRTNDIIFGLGILVIFGYAYALDIDRASILQLLGLFAAAAYKFLPSFNRVLNGLLTMKNSSFVFDELKAIRHSTLSAFEKVPATEFKNEIQFRNLSYQYPEDEEKVLNDVSFDIKKGETIGFIGSSGSGKSTLLKIILRLLEESTGQILIDGNHIDQKLSPSFQKIIGYVQQEIFIFNDTVKSNIAFGDDDVDEEKFAKSIKDAQLDDFLNTHPKGSDLLLGENGVNLSGGQKQRIGIARALYKDAEILIFDEVTSALDGETEKAVVESINHLTQIGKTVIIVAHRISTLEKCHRIYELQEGKVSGVYSYPEVVDMMKVRQREIAMT